VSASCSSRCIGNVLRGLFSGNSTASAACSDRPHDPHAWADVELGLSMGDIEGGDPPSSRRGFSLRGWLNPRERGRAAAAANTAPQGPELPFTHPFRRISAVPEERYAELASCTCDAAADVSTAAVLCCCCCCLVCLGHLYCQT
jgi:hypothetical protein